MKISFFTAAAMVTICCFKDVLLSEEQRGFNVEEKVMLRKAELGRYPQVWDFTGEKKKAKKKKIKIKTSVWCPPNTGHLYNSLCTGLCRLSKGCSLFQFQWVPGTAPPSSSWNSPGCSRGGGNTRCANYIFNQQKIAGENDTFKANLPQSTNIYYSAVKIFKAWRSNTSCRVWQIEIRGCGPRLLINVYFP